MKIKSGGLDVLEAGVVHSYLDNPVEFLFPDGDEEMLLRIIINRGSEQAINLKLVKENELDIIYSPAHTLNFGSKEPMLIGSLQDREFYCQLRVSVYGDFESYNVDYTFFLGRSIQ